MNFDPVVVAMVAAIQMLDQAGSDEVEPDFAVHVQQVIGVYLSELTREDAVEFCQILSACPSVRLQT